MKCVRFKLKYMLSGAFSFIVICFSVTTSPKNGRQSARGARDHKILLKEKALPSPHHIYCLQQKNHFYLLIEEGGKLFM